MIHQCKKLNVNAHHKLEKLIWVLHFLIINLLYQILDTGVLKDSKGENIYFNNTIIIMTSNIGFTRNSIGFNTKNTGNINEYFDTPLINRIDSIIEFNTMQKTNIEYIIKEKLKKLKMKYKNYGIIIKIGNKIVNEIILLSNYKEYGARKIDKIIKNELEPLIINKILENQKNIFIKNLKKEKVIN